MSVMYWLAKRLQSPINAKNLQQFYEINSKPINGRLDGMSVPETVDLGSISGRVKPKTIKISIYSFPARRSAIKGTV